jgi:uncharacterized radical SAM superfamily protein
MAVDKRKPTKSDWSELAASWEIGSLEIDDVLEKFDIKADTFYKKMSSLGAKKGVMTEKAKKEALEEVKMTIAGDKDVIAERIKETDEEHYRTNVMYSKLANKIIADAVKSGKAISTAAPDLKALQIAQAINASIRAERYKITGADLGREEEPNVETFSVEVMTAEDIEELNRKSEEHMHEFGEQS